MLVVGEEFHTILRSGKLSELLRRLDCILPAMYKDHGLFAISQRFTRFVVRNLRHECLPFHRVFLCDPDKLLRQWDRPVRLIKNEQTGVIVDA